MKKCYRCEKEFKDDNEVTPVFTRHPSGEHGDSRESYCEKCKDEMVSWGVEK